MCRVPGWLVLRGGEGEVQMVASAWLVSYDMSGALALRELRRLTRGVFGAYRGGVGRVRSSANRLFGAGQHSRACEKAYQSAYELLP